MNQQGGNPAQTLLNEARLYEVPGENHAQDIWWGWVC
jgi:hypothetical protein